MRIFVTGAAPADVMGDVAIAVEALRAGRGSVATIGSGRFSDCLELHAGRVPPRGALAELRGFARTSPQPQGKGDLQPARAIRRALADARMNALEVGYACAVELGGTDPVRARAALERGLGRFWATTLIETAADPFRRAVMAVRGRDGPSGSVALVITPGDGSIALAFGRP